MILSITEIFLEHNGQFEKHNRVTFGELLKSIIGKKKGSIIDSGLKVMATFEPYPLKECACAVQLRPHDSYFCTSAYCGFAMVSKDGHEECSGRSNITKHFEKV